MNLGLFSYQQTRRNQAHPEKETVFQRTRRRKLFSRNLSGCFTPKHYPRIFLDPRLKSNLFL
jgi:hypothetical protein